MALNYHTEAVVLAARDTGRADRLLTLFSREYGKIVAIAYGVRNSKKRQSGALQPFAHLDIFLSSSKGKGIDIAEQWATKTSFQKLREDLSMVAYASFLSELVGELWPEREADSQVFDLILKAFYLVSSRNPRIAALAGAFRLIYLAGFHPSYDVCIHCGQDIVADAYFDCLAGGAACFSCRDGKQHSEREPLAALTPQMRGFISLLESIFTDAPPVFSVNAQTLAQTEKLLFNYLNCHLELNRELKSLSFIRQMNSLP